MYINLEDALFEWVVSAEYLKDFSLGPVEYTTKFMGMFSKFIVGVQYFTLIEVELDARNAEPPMAFLGWMLWVKVDRLSQGSA